MARLKCHACGARLSPSAAWCSYCGEKIRRRIAWPLIALGIGLAIVVTAWIVWTVQTPG
jgi:hypothetical protein